MDGFDPAWIGERYARATQGRLPAARPVHGGDFRRKGGDDLLDAWRAGQLGARARLDIVTSAPLEPRRLSEGVSVHTGVTAHSPEWRRLWRDADLFVLPTRDEAFGLVFQEAAAAGLPAIGTRINAIPELVHDRRSGLLVEPGAIEALTGALNCLIDSADLRRDLGARGRELILRTAHPDSTAASWRPFGTWPTVTARRVLRSTRSEDACPNPPDAFDWYRQAQPPDRSTSR